MYGVVVVGGGPAGSKTAAMLAKDHDVLVLEEHSRVGEPVQCAGLITERSIELSGVKPEILNKYTGANVIFPNGKTVTVQSSDVKAVMIDRADFDTKLSEKAMDAGAQYSFSTRYLSHTVKDGNVSVSSTSGESTARLLIGADGHSSKVAMSIPENGPKEYMRGIEYDIKRRMDQQDIINIRIGTDIAPGLFSWEAPFGEYTRVGLCSAWSAGPPIEMMRILMKRIGADDCEIMKKYCGKVPVGRRRRMYSDNLMLIGDAASQVKPVSAGGIYPIMMSTGPLCQTAEEAFAKDDFSAKVLSSYEKRWNPIVGKELDKAYKLRKIYLKFNNDDMNSIYPYMSKKSVNDALNTVDIDNPSISAFIAFRNIPTAFKLATTVIKAKVRR